MHVYILCIDCINCIIIFLPNYSSYLPPPPLPINKKIQRIVYFIYVITFVVLQNYKYCVEKFVVRNSGDSISSSMPPPPSILHDNKTTLMYLCMGTTICVHMGGMDQHPPPPPPPLADILEPDPLFDLLFSSY